jgi:hypothetical protein
MNNGLLVNTTQDSIQARARGELPISPGMLLMRLLSGAYTLPPWWSPARDTALREFVQKVDHLSGAVYTMTSKMTSIPFKIVPLDYTNEEQVAQAEIEYEKLMYNSEFGDGWEAFYGKCVEQLLTTDNGMFAEVVGPGLKDSILVGRPYGVAALDSSRCQRTGHPIFPVIYHDIDGKMYKLHYTRVMFRAQQESPRADMLSVGYSAVSRCINVSQNLYDIAIFKQEKMGSRPRRDMFVTRGGLDPEDMQSAFTLIDSTQDQMGLSRYAKSPIVGNSAIPEAEVQHIILSSMPDGFNEESSTMLGVATIALAFGVDARELFPTMGGGATRADALLAHLKQKGKGPGSIIQIMESSFKFKFLPPYLKMVFDYQDDAEDMQAAEIRHVRSQARQRDLLSGAIDERVAREKMLADSEITQRQFELMELEDGRMKDGSNVLTLFFAKNGRMKKLLALEGVDNPLTISENDPDFVKMRASEGIARTYEEYQASKNDVRKLTALQAEAALKALVKLYEEEQEKSLKQEQVEMALEGGGNAEGNGKGGPRVKRNDPTRRQGDMSTKPGGTAKVDDIQPGRDEKVNL